MRISDWSSDVCSSDLEAIRIAVGEGVRVLNFAFHSPSLVPGHTPYVRDAADLAAFHAWWDRVLDLLDRLGVAALGADALIAAAEAIPASVLASVPPPAYRRRTARESVELGKRVSVRVDLGGRSIIEKKKKMQLKEQTAHK